MSDTIGPPTTARPTADGTLKKATSFSAEPSVAFAAGRSRAAAACATPAPATVAMATPKTPSGSCMSRKAICSQVTAPAWCEAKMVLTRMLTCVAESPITEAAMSRPMRRSPGSASRSRVNPSMGRHPEARSEGTWASNWSSPPSKVPSAQPCTARSGGHPAHQSPRPTAMDPTLKRAGASAGAVKRPCALSIPIATAESETRSRNGIITWVRPAATPENSASSPGAMSATTWSAQATPAKTIAPTSTSTSDTTVPASRHAASGPRLRRASAKVGTKALESAPSAKRSRSRLGMRNATTKASDHRLAPMRMAKIWSRRSPSTREAMVAPDSQMARPTFTTSCPGSPGPPAPSSSGTPWPGTGWSAGRCDRAPAP
jgi:hypothetical protein